MGVVGEVYSSVWRQVQGFGNFCMVWSQYGSGEGRILQYLEISGGVGEFQQDLKPLWEWCGKDTPVSED